MKNKDFYSNSFCLVNFLSKMPLERRRYFSDIDCIEILADEELLEKHQNYYTVLQGNKFSLFLLFFCLISKLKICFLD